MAATPHPQPVPQPQGAPSVPQAHTRGAPAVPVPLGNTEEGLASWYGPPYHGRQAADGEIYDMEKMTAAHRTLPFNTWVRVTNMANGKTAEVRITDRGPFIDGRIIDLSKAAARELDLLGPGVGPVHLEVIHPPALPVELAAAPGPSSSPSSVPREPLASPAPPETPLTPPASEDATPPPSPQPSPERTYDVADLPTIESELYAVQIGAFSVLENAQHVRDRFSRYGNAQLVARQGATTIWRVVVGHFDTQAAAQELANQLESEVGHAVFVVRLDPKPPTH